MSELFSNERLIDYFAIIDVEITNIDRTLNSDVFDKLTQSFAQESSPCLKADYTYTVTNVYPKKAYNDNNYTLNFDTFFPLMPEERVYLTQMPNTFYSYMIPNEKGQYYYVFFYKVYIMVNKNNESVSKIKEFNNGYFALYAPKYLCFVSLHPYYISFKKLLEEIYYNSLKNSHCFKVENILNVLLYRMFLPKYHCTQLSFCLGDNAYQFINWKFRSEIGYKFFFNKISIENAVMLVMAMILNSVIVIFHSDLEVISPFIYLLIQLLYPFPMNYSIVNNLSIAHVELLGFNGGLIAGVYKNDFNDLSSIMKENFNRIVYYDIDQNILMLDTNEHFKEKKVLPLDKIKGLIARLYQVVVHSNSNNSNNNGKMDIDCNGNNMVDCYVRSAFYDFYIEMFNGINLDKQTVVYEDIPVLNTFNNNSNANNIKGSTKDHHLHDESLPKVNFDYDGFLKETISDFYTFLDTFRSKPAIKGLIQIMNGYYLVNKKKVINDTVLDKDTMDDITMFFNGIDYKKKGKTTESLFMVNIINTITISSPAYEKISYRQNNIFADPFHEELIKHTTAIPFHKYTGIGLNYYYSKAQRRDEDNLNNNSIKNINSSSLPQKSKGQQLLSNQWTLIYNQLLLEFKEYLIGYIDSLKNFFGLLPNTHILDSLKINHYNHNQQQHNTSIVSSIIQSNKKSFIGSNKPVTSTSATPTIISKEAYIESFNKVIKLMRSKGEFHINFASNVIESFCQCPHCNKPNNIWDIRKSFEFSKARRETRSKCKYCYNSYVPYFKTIFIEQVLSNKTKQYETVYTQKKNEYMSFEHITILMTEGEISKKLPANLCSNITLIMGEIKCVIDKDIKIYSIDSFLLETEEEEMVIKGTHGKKATCILTQTNNKDKNKEKEKTKNKIEKSRTDYMIRSQKGR